MITDVFERVNRKAFGKCFKGNVATGLGDENLGFVKGRVERVGSVAIDEDFVFVGMEDLGTVGDEVVLELFGANEEGKTDLMAFGGMREFSDKGAHFTTTSAGTAGDNEGVNFLRVFTFKGEEAATETGLIAAKDFVVDGEGADGDAVMGNAVAHDVDFGFFHWNKVVDILGGDFPKSMGMDVGDIEKDGAVGEGFGGEKGGGPMSGGNNALLVGKESS